MQLEWIQQSLRNVIIIHDPKQAECRMFSREKSLKASHVKVIHIPISSEYLKQFLEPFRMWKHLWNRLEMVRILFENPLWTSGEFGGFCVDSYYMLYKKETSVESSFSRTPAPSKFSSRNLNCPASKSNTRQTEWLMLLLVVFNQRSIENPSANCQIILEKCSFRSDQHLQPGFCALQTVTPPWFSSSFVSLMERRFSKQYLVIN